MADEPLVTLAQRLQGLCLGRGLTIATAESCTGGLVAGAITEIAGSSGYFLGGVVAYADRVKASQLGVPETLLAAHGAVSAQVARAMAAGVRERLAADLSVAVTGVAGPGGGSEEKPLGLAYIAVADAHGIDVQRHLWAGDRRAMRQASAAAALEMLIDRVGRSPASSPASASGR